MNQRLAEYAAAYAGIGLIPIPLKQNSKFPAITKWQRSPPMKAGDARAAFAGHAGNVGATFPPDLFALDLDRKEGKDGIAVIEATAEAFGGLPVTLTQQTPSGGEHRIFRKPPGLILTNTVGKLPGVDIRAKGAQIAVEPSVIDGGRYTWLDWEPGQPAEIADAPQWLLDLLTGSRPPAAPDSAQSGSGNTHITPRQIVELRSALCYLDPDPYESWVDCGQALKGLGDTGRDLWMEWGARSQKFDAGEASRKWDELRGERTGYAAIFSKAQQAEWTNPMSKAPAPAGVRAGAFPFARAAELLADQSPPVWLIDDLIEAGTLGQVFGKSGCGKSFLVMDWAACIATGRTWQGNATAAGGVFYIAGEGFAGFKRRLRAWEMHTGESLATAPLFFSRRSAALMDAGNAQAVIEAVRALQADHGKPALIVVDTLHRNMGGDESSTRDMALFLQSMDAMRAELEAAALVVHHPGLMDATRGRGSGSLYAGLDHEYLLTKHPDGRRELTCTKAKEAEPPPARWFDLEHVDLDWPDGKGGFQSSAVLIDAEAGPQREKRLTRAQHAGMESFYRAAATHGSEAGERFGVELEAWRAEFYRASTADNAPAKKIAFRRARNDLKALGKLTVDNDVYSCRADDPALGAARLLATSEKQKSDADDF